MENDSILQKSVQKVVTAYFSPLSSPVNSSVNHNTVTIVGQVEHFSTKLAVENCVWNVLGVEHIINQIDIIVTSWEHANDAVLTEHLQSLLKWDIHTHTAIIEAHVLKGWATLSGQVLWQYQIEEAIKLARNSIGIKGITNLMSLQPLPLSENSQAQLNQALRSHISLQHLNIIVAIAGSTITLTGNAELDFQKDLAERIAWKTPGIIAVINHLQTESFPLKQTRF